MKYNAYSSNFLMPGETEVLSGCVISGTTGYTKSCDFRLTNKKIIMSEEDALQIIPLNQITDISIYSYRSNELNISTAKGSVTIQLTADREWADRLVYEISKRVGEP